VLGAPKATREMSSRSDTDLVNGMSSEPLSVIAIIPSHGTSHGQDTLKSGDRSCNTWLFEDSSRVAFENILAFCAKI